jgi:hypothetical protein
MLRYLAIGRFFWNDLSRCKTSPKCDSANGINIHQILNFCLSHRHEGKKAHMGRFETSQKRVTFSGGFAFEPEDCQSVRSATYAFSASSGNNPR